MKKTVLLIIPVAMVIGSVVALFLTLLQAAISFRFQHPWLLWLLPVAGVAIYFLYSLYGKSSDKGNNLIMEEIHRPGGGVPRRMAPLILLSTVMTHLFGGSAGREGTAVQIGGSTAAMFGKWFNLTAPGMQLLLTCGIAAGFGAVFGTPSTGAVFAVEVLTLRKINYSALLPALLASFVADATLSGWGVHHHAYAIDDAVKQTDLLYHFLPASAGLLVKIVIASIAFGLASLLFSSLTHRLKDLFQRMIKIKWLIPVLGGLLIIAFSLINGKPDYLSLGVDPEYPGAVTISSAFEEKGADADSWLWKTLYTAVTLSSGFKGGEVTPLFYIGATLGNTLSQLLHAPVSLFAALGFIAVFAGATNTPVACSIMGMELFGPAYGLLFAIACFTAYLFSGHTGIYTPRQLQPAWLNRRDPHPLRQYLRYFLIKIDKYSLKFSTKKKSK